MVGRSASLVGLVCLAAGLGGCRAHAEPNAWEDDPVVTLCGRDGNCDEECRYDPDCGEPGCAADGVCRAECAEGTDPDCEEPTCEADGECDESCADDPDCHPEGTCEEDGHCVLSCDGDPDCEGMDCSGDGSCNGVCPEGWDPDCAAPTCGGDGVCETRCPAGTDPDCDTPSCSADGFCNPSCAAGTDPDCGTSECGADRWCNPSCAYGVDPDCGTTSCGYADGPCCTSGSACEGGAECISLDGTSDICLELCSPTVCSYGGADGSCLDFFSGSGVCMGETLTPSTCVEGSTSCTTDYGVSTGTVCVGDGWETYCLESCVVAPSGCDTSHACVPFMGMSDLGACVPAM